MNDALVRLDLVFVRDGASQRYLEEIADRPWRFHRAPDFTNLLHPELPARLDGLRGKSVLIPNEKMVTGKPDQFRSTYLSFLKTAADLLRAKGKPCFILVHEGAKDRALAKELNGILDEALPIVDEPSPLVTKAIISVCEMSVSSRFHGLVSGLSSAVPSLACGWSHKYLELMADYGCRELVADIDKPESWDSKVEQLISSAEDPAFRARLSASGATERDNSERMWSMVVDLIQA